MFSNPPNQPKNQPISYLLSLKIDLSQTFFGVLSYYWVHLSKSLSLVLAHLIFVYFIRGKISMSVMVRITLEDLQDASGMARWRWPMAQHLFFGYRPPTASIHPIIHPPTHFLPL